ncbi:hypothetical protein BRADI_3g48910v3, partial [Brachypodium distachyon]
MGARDLDDDGIDLEAMFWNSLPALLGALAALAILVPLLYWPLMWSVDEGKFPEYTVAVAGFSGLDIPADPAHGGALISPTFDLTVRIREPRRYSAACVERGTTASVSYAGVALAGVALAGGPVPEFCARKENTTEASHVMAWGQAVAVPEFAVARLAQELSRGDAAVDVTIKAPARLCRHSYSCEQEVVDCRVALGRGGEGSFSAPCRVSILRVPTLPDDMGQPGRKVLMPRGDLA